MTEQGREVARRIQSRHETLSRFFSLFGIDAETQQQDIEGIEHHLSANTVTMLADLTHFFQERPEMLRKFQQTRGKKRKKIQSLTIQIYEEISHYVYTCSRRRNAGGS